MNENKEEIVTEEDLKKIDPRLLEKIKKGVRREVLEELAKRIEKRLSEEA